MIYILFQFFLWQGYKLHLSALMLLDPRGKSAYKCNVMPCRIYWFSPSLIISYSFWLSPVVSLQFNALPTCSFMRTFLKLGVLINWQWICQMQSRSNSSYWMKNESCPLRIYHGESLRKNNKVNLSFCHILIKQASFDCNKSLYYSQAFYGSITIKIYDDIINHCWILRLFTK